MISVENNSIEIFHILIPKRQKLTLFLKIFSYLPANTHSHGEGVFVGRPFNATKEENCLSLLRRT